MIAARCYCLGMFGAEHRQGAKGCDYTAKGAERIRCAGCGRVIVSASSMHPTGFGEGVYCEACWNRKARWMGEYER